MRRPTPALVTSLFAGLALAACGPGDEPASTEQDVGFEFMGTDTTCEREPRQPLTSPIHEITVEGGEIVVEPHPLVQPPGPAGIIAWRSRTHNWRVHYPDGSPLPDTVYEGQGNGRLVFDRVRRDAPCRAYDYVVEVWRDQTEQQAVPDTMSRPYPAALADTVNGDEIEPFIFRRSP